MRLHTSLSFLDIERQRSAGPTVYVLSFVACNGELPTSPAFFYSFPVFLSSPSFLISFKLVLNFRCLTKLEIGDHLAGLLMASGCKGGEIMITEDVSYKLM